MYQENPLYSRLRALRQQIGTEKGLPLYFIFTNKTLEDMAVSMPSTMDELGRVNGVGKTKLKQYGERFLNEILAYRDENNITQTITLPPKPFKNEHDTPLTGTTPFDIAIYYPEKKDDSITIENFEALKASLQELLASYEDVLYTPEQLKKAKKDKATLNKMRKAIGARRKEIKEICLEPFYQVDAQLRELQLMIDIPLGRIAEFTAEMEQVEKDTKAANIKMYFDMVSGVLGSIAEDVFFSNWFYNKKWENKTYPDWQWQNDIKQKIGIITQDIKELTKIAGINSSAVIAKYVETGNKDLAIEFLHSITTIIQDQNRQIITAEKESIINPPQPNNKNVQNETQSQANSEMLINITGTSGQHQAVLQFLNALDLKYEIISISP